MTLRARIISVSLLANAIVALASLLAIGSYQSNLEQRLEGVATAGTSVLWSRVVAGRLDRIESSTSALTRNREALAALASADAAELESATLGPFNRLKTSHIVSSLQLVTLNGDVIASHPDGGRGTLRSALAEAALRETTVTRGVERDEKGKLVAALAVPLFSRGKPIGCALLQRDLDVALADVKQDLGSESFILSADGAVEYATDEDFARQLDLSVPEPGKSAVERATLGERSYSVVIHPVLDSQGTALAHVASARDDTEEYQQLRFIRGLSYGVAPLVLLAVGVSLYLYVNRAFRPLHTVVTAMDHVAERDLTASIEVRSTDEVGRIAKAANRAVAAIGGAMRSIRDQGESLCHGASRLAELSGHIATSVSRLAESADSASGSSAKMSDNATAAAKAVEESSASLRAVVSAIDETSTNLANVVSESEQMRESVHSISTIADEMRTGMDEVASDASQAVTVANDAARAAADTDETVRLLGSSANEIGKVVSVITEIAEQTNLLALNATIEAASAGDAGRGFAVVANEVKELAKQTAQATDEIRAKIEGMQANTAGAVKEIKAIDAVIGELNRSSKSIAASAEQQRSRSQDVTHSVQATVAAAKQIDSMIQQASRGVQDVAANAEQIANRSDEISRSTAEASSSASAVSATIAEVTRLAREAADESSQAGASSGEINELAASMREAVNTFKV